MDTKEQGLANDESVWWLDVYIDSKGNIQHITQELETFGDKKLVKRR